MKNLIVLATITSLLIHPLAQGSAFSLGENPSPADSVLGAGISQCFALFHLNIIQQAACFSKSENTGTPAPRETSTKRSANTDLLLPGADTPVTKTNLQTARNVFYDCIPHIARDCRLSYCPMQTLPLDFCVWLSAPPPMALMRLLPRSDVNPAAATMRGHGDSAARLIG